MQDKDKQSFAHRLTHYTTHNSLPAFISIYAAAGLFEKANLLNVLFLLDSLEVQIIHVYLILVFISNIFS